MPVAKGESLCSAALCFPQGGPPYCLTSRLNALPAILPDFRQNLTLGPNRLYYL